MIDAIAHSPLFKSCSSAELESIVKEFKRQRSAGDFIFREGDTGDCLHLLLSGSVQVCTNNQAGEEIVLARLEKGAHFGEQALLTAKPLRRHASVRALTDVETGTLTHAVFQRRLGASADLRRLLPEIGRDQLILK